MIRTSCLCIALALASGCGSTGGQGAADAGGVAAFTIVGAAADGRVGLGYLAQLTLHGTAPADVAWSVSGSAPPGLAVTGSPGAAELAGTPTASGDFDFTVSAQASSGERATLELQLTIDAEVTLGGSLPDGVEGVPYSAALTLVGTPRGDVRWTLSALPAGLLFDEDTATLSGLPAAGTYSISVQAADNLGLIGQLQLSFVIAPAVTIDAVSLPDGTVSIPYQAAFQSHGGLGFHLWSISAGALPPGLSLAQNSGVLSGVPTASGSFDFTVFVAGGSGSFAQLPATIVVRRNLAIAATAVPGAGKIAADYAGTVIATGAASDADYAWSISSGALPAGLVLGSTGGIASISGKPAEAGDFTFNL
ncbi:MAG TPA: Ig domain-containing protein, partial [Myxococcales bacterium]|nr:Ig domain-containing protein [Myxococcales bacterium]